MIIRPLKKGDLSEVTQHLKRSLSQNDIEALGFEPDITHLEKTSFLDPDYNKDLLLGAFIEDKCIGTIMGVTRLWKEGREDTGYIKWILVDPDYRKKGTGTLLYKQIEDIFIKMDLKTFTFGSSSPSYFLPGIPIENEEAAEFFENRGWKRDFNRVSLLVKLSEKDLNHKELSLKPKYKKPYKIITATSSNSKELVNFVDIEFPGSWSNEVKMAMEGANPNSGSVICIDENSEIIGFAAFNGSNPQWFGPMGVKESLRKEGFGRILFYEAIKEMMRRGMIETILPWINGKEEFYPRFFNDYKWKKYFKFNKEL